MFNLIAELRTCKISKGQAGFVVLAGLMLCGCASSPLPPPDTSQTGVNKGPKFLGPPSDAGLEVKPSTDVKQFPALVKDNAGRFHPRQNPFALTSNEKTFDSTQASEKIFNSTGFTTLVEPKSEVAPPVEIEAQPYRRLSGVVVGDSVVAIIEMGDGQQPEIVRPGSKIPNSPWTVVSIDQDKAVLRREGSVLPHEIEVRLEVAPPGYGGSANTGSASGIGGPGMGGPGMGAPGMGGPGMGGPGGPGGGRGRLGGPGGGFGRPGASGGGGSQGD